MAHIGQESALGAVGSISFFFRFLQCQFQIFLLSNILGYTCNAYTPAGMVFDNIP
ncbi:hypothetical protein SDC9_163808 [bioreactor metagenome]|uniref:Uncharacterized protein n=1 Tax=bioreactor metagenome TaxID=1076179 RepID=A0A645FX20_9ZZZZ